MLFNSTTYGVFLFVAYVGFWLLRAHRRYRTLFLIAASYVFYVYGTYDTAIEQTREGQYVPFGPTLWTVLCFGIIFVGSTLDYAIGRVLGVTETPWKRKALLLGSVFYYLGVLFIFKYYDLFLGSFAYLASKAGVPMTHKALNMVLPFGISFFTFETMSYTIDVYRRELEPAKSYTDYLLFVCFFPHLVAGPIVRPEQMLPQFGKDPEPSDERTLQAFLLIAQGLMKKVAIGDVLKANMVGRIFDNPERFSSLEVLFGVYAYAIQIYADFSGYTDVAIGSARLFGYELPENFNAPYTSSSLQEFWHRWHISLSTWLRDYLYIPLGGSRGSQGRTYFNLMMTMLLGGLWHGATSWNFVIWGFLHGLALGVTRLYQRRFPPPKDLREVPIWRRVLNVIATFHYVCFAWVFFRAKNPEAAFAVLERIGVGKFGTTNLPAKVVLLIAVGAALHWVPRKWEDALRDRFGKSHVVLQAAVLAALAYALHFASGSKAEPFVYGQF
jgi:D-alanyl-lipoteichoic acid acyltransferase DltB (MBOAT superfamily)